MTTPVERRFVTAYREADRDEPGLIQEDDGTVWQVNPDGTRVELTASGGSLPDEWTVGDDGDLTIATTDPTGNDILRLEAPEGYHQSSGDGYLLHLFAGDGTDILNFDPSGALHIQSAAEEGIWSELSLARGDDPSGNSSNIRSAASSLDRIVVSLAGRNIFKVLASGAIVTGANAAPADGELAAGQMALWLDDTIGASKLMVKAKEADGTVRTGFLTL